MKRTLTIVIIALILLHLGACGLTKWATSVQDLVAAVDKQVTSLCDAGALSATACSYWAELKAWARESWENAKTSVLEFIKGLFRGEINVPAAEAAPASLYARVDPTRILDAARGAAKKGFITEVELAALEAAAAGN